MQGADPIRNAKQIDARVEFLRLKRQRREHHVTAVGSAQDADFLSVNKIKGLQIFLRLDAIPERLAAMLLVVGFVERLAVTARAAVVHVEHRVTVIYEILNARDVRHPRLSARSTVHAHDRRHFVLRRRAVRLIKNRRNFDPIERFVAHDLRVGEIGRANLGIQTFG